MFFFLFLQAPVLLYRISLFRNGTASGTARLARCDCINAVSLLCLNHPSPMNYTVCVHRRPLPKRKDANRGSF